MPNFPSIFDSLIIFFLVYSTKSAARVCIWGRREGIYYQLINSIQSDHHRINRPRSTGISALSPSYTAHLFSYHSSSFFYVSFLSSAPTSSFHELLFFSHLFILPLFIHLFALLPFRRSLHPRIHALHPSCPSYCSASSFFSFSQSTDITSSAITSAFASTSIYSA